MQKVYAFLEDLALVIVVMVLTIIATTLFWRYAYLQAAEECGSAYRDTCYVVLK